MFVDESLTPSAALDVCENIDGCWVTPGPCENGLGVLLAGCWAEGQVKGLCVALEAGSDDDWEGLDMS